MLQTEELVLVQQVPVAPDVVGDIKASGNIVAGGNITLGDAATDTVTFTADVALDIIPDADNTHDSVVLAKFAAVHATNPHGLQLMGDFVHQCDPVISPHKQLTTQVEQLIQHLQIQISVNLPISQQNTITSQQTNIV